MNIVVVGGSIGGTFGGDFVNKATQNGHTVVNYSYREQSINEIVREFKACIPKYIDILIYKIITLQIVDMLEEKHGKII
jgi:NADP-dependent 3-hydroxy acid dehydrogenase YdfG